ncbi:permease prefix domain 1-containing protein [Agromyces soli]
MTATLTDRYVAAALRSAPEAQRAELERELRERIGDEVDALVEQGEEAGDAEYRALSQLGDPAALTAGYLDRPLFLIGPRYFLVWWRLLKLLWAVVLPIVAAAFVLAQLIAGAAVNTIIGQTVSVALTTGVHIGFWTTLVFAVLERLPAEPGRRGIDEPWKPERLPQLDETGRPNRLSELVASLVFLAIAAAAIVWQQFGWPWVPALEGVPLLDPALWTFWLPYFLVLLVLEAAFAVVLYRRGWSWPLAFCNIALNVAFTVPALWLFATGRLFNPAALDAIGWPWGEASTVIVPLIVVVVLAGAVWDTVDGVVKTVKARGRGSRG